MTQQTQRVSALLLAAIMLAAVVSGTAVLAGPAAAAPNTDLQHDATVTSGAIHWTGQTLYLNDSSADDVSYVLRRVTGDSLGAAPTEIEMTDGEGVVDVSGLSGEYVVTDDDGNVRKFDADGQNVSFDSATTRSERIREAKFRITEQTLSAAFDEQTVENDGDDTVRQLEIDSNRGEYTVSVGSDNLSESDLHDIFADNDDAVMGTYTDDDTQYVRLRAGPDSTFTANFDGVDAGTYNLTVETDDTEVETTATVEVAQTNVDMRLKGGRITAHAGGYLDVRVELSGTDDAYVWLGSARSNMLERIHVEDTNGDGVAEFSVNTFYAGRDVSKVDEMDSVAYPYSSENDTVLSAVRPRDEDGPQTTVDGLYPTDNEMRISDALHSQMEPNSYKLAVSSSKRYGVDSGGDVVVPTKTDYQYISLEDGAVSGVETLAAPKGESLNDLDEIRQRARPADTVAEGDHLVIRMEATGLDGILRPDGYHAADFQNNEGLYLIIAEADDGSNRDVVVSDLTGDGYTVVEDSENDTYYMVVDTENAEMFAGGFETGERYEVRLVLTGAKTDFFYNLDHYYPEDEMYFSNNPYLDTDEVRAANTSVTLSDRSAEFLDVNDGTLSLPQSTDASVGARTTLAPGSDVTVRLVDDTTLYMQSVTVSDEQTLSAAFDLSDADVGQSLTIELRSQGDVLATQSVTVVEPSTPTETPTETMTETEEETNTETETTTTADSQVSSPTDTATAASVSSTPSAFSGDSTTIVGVVALLTLGGGAVVMWRRNR